MAVATSGYTHVVPLLHSKRVSRGTQNQERMPVCPWNAVSMSTIVYRVSPLKCKPRSWWTDCSPSSWTADLNCGSGLAMFPLSLNTCQRGSDQRAAYSGSPRRQLTLRSALLDSYGTASQTRCGISTIRVRVQRLPCTTSIGRLLSSTIHLGSSFHTPREPRSLYNVPGTRKVDGMIPTHQRTCSRLGNRG